MSEPVRIAFTPRPSGWAACELSVGGVSHRMPGISDTTDPLGDLVRAALMIRTGAPKATLSFDDEPMETRWILETGWWSGVDWIDAFRVRLLTFASLYDPQPDEQGILVFTAQCDATEFVRAVLVEAERLLEPDNKSWMTESGLAFDGSKTRVAVKALQAALQA